MQISGVILSLPWPLRLCLLRVLLGRTATVTSFPLSKHTGGSDTAPTFSGLRVYLQFTWEVGLPPSPVEFSSHCHCYKLPAPGCWACAAVPAFSSQLVVRDFLSPTLPHSGCPAFFATCLFCCYCLSFSFFFLFSLGGDWSVQGIMLIWPRVICGSTACHLAHLLVFIFPSSLGAAIWQWRGSPPGFSI
jgi:hypothetical protein